MFPSPIWPQDLVDLAHFKEYLHSVPFLGEYEGPKGSAWKRMDVGGSYRVFFVDATGNLRKGGPALTIEELRLILLARCAFYGYRFGLSIYEVGQFQVYLSLHERTEDA